MLKLHYKAKFRVFGITLGTIEDTKDVSGLISALAAKIFPQFPTILTSALQPLSQPFALYNDRGVLIELV